MSRQVEHRGLMGLPSEVLVMVLARVPLLELANVRMVCRRLQLLVDGPSGRRLWSTVSLEGLQVGSKHQPLIERSASCGNLEALIKLSVAYLYNQGVPKGTDGGTLNSSNGLRAMEYICQMEKLTVTSRPFSWVLIRPPWSSAVSNKVCVYHKMVEKCLGEEEEIVPALFYSIGQTITFLEAGDKFAEDGQKAVEWFERGASHNCPFSALEVWRERCKPNLATKETHGLRSLRKIIAMGNSSCSQEAKLELCTAYAAGRYGSVGGEGALQYIQELMAASQPILSKKIFKVQKDITNIMRYITVDWMVEIAELKNLSPNTLHLAVALFDHYLLTRQVDRSNLQLLGVTAILVASRWGGATMLTIRESSWLTENTYSYEEVVRMMAELLGAFRGDIRKYTICDYLDILLTLSGANSSTRQMCYYLSESILLHPDCGRYSSAHLAAACLLNANILLKQDYPWPVQMEQATGYSLSSLRKCCLMIYQRWYSHHSQLSISKQEIMPLCQLSEQLGVHPDSLNNLITPKAKVKVKDKLLSFLSDSCYRSLFESHSESDSELGSDEEEEEVEEEEEEEEKKEEEDVDSSEDYSSNESDYLGAASASSSASASASFCSLPSTSFASPRSSSSLALKGHPPSSSPSPLPTLHSSPCHSSQPLIPNLTQAQSFSVLLGSATASSSSFPTQYPSSSTPVSPLLSRHSNRAHASCPDFHTYSTNMEVDQNSCQEMETAQKSPSGVRYIHPHMCEPVSTVSHCHSHSSQPLIPNLTPAQSFSVPLGSATASSSSLPTQYPPSSSPVSPLLSRHSNRAHASCPDCHTYSTDMEVDQNSCQETDEMETAQKSSSGVRYIHPHMREPVATVSHCHSKDLEFSLPPLREPPQPHSILESSYSLQRYPEEPPRGNIIQDPLPPITLPPLNASKDVKTMSPYPHPKPKLCVRPPLQPLHNTPSALASRHTEPGHKTRSESGHSQQVSLSFLGNRKF